MFSASPEYDARRVSLSRTFAARPHSHNPHSLLLPTLPTDSQIGPLRKVEDESGSYEYESADISLTVTADLLARVRREALASNVLTERFIQSTQELIEVATLLRVRNVVHDPIRASNTTAELSKTFQQRTNETAKSLAVIEADLLLMEQEVCESLRRSADVYRIVNKGSG